MGFFLLQASEIKDTVADKAKQAGKTTYDAATQAGQDAVDSTKGAAASVADTIKSYLMWGKDKATDLQDMARRSSEVRMKSWSPISKCCIQLVVLVLHV
jgi:hypothetical protein